MTRPLGDLTGTELSAKLAAGDTSATEILASTQARIDAVDGQVRAFLTPTPQLASERADELDTYLSTGAPQSPVAGIPVALKDVLTTNGIRTTCGSKILETYVPPYDATAWTRLSGAGAVLVGKTNCDEFAMGSSNENSAYGPVYNPWDLERVPGGSSGGAAAAVAAGEAVWALGTDTGGSVRQPASLCGVVGLKPTYGRISRYGLIAFASSLDTVGTFTRSVRDAGSMLQVLAGHDPRDATSLDIPVPEYGAHLDEGVAGLRVGVVSEAFGEGVEPAVAASVRAAIERLAALGAEVGEAVLPHATYALSAYYLIAPSECSSNLARYDGVRYGLRVPRPTLLETYCATRAAGFGREVKRRIMLGTYALRAGYYDQYYRQAQCVRTLVREDFRQAFARCDLLATPTSPVPAFRLGEKLADPLAMYLCDAYTTSANLAGLPGMSLPCGFTAAGLPVGLQLLGRPLEEETIFRAAFAYEAVEPFSARRPPDPETP